MAAALKYTAFGLTIKSMIELPGLKLTTDNEPIDVTIEVRDLNLYWDTYIGTDPYNFLVRNEKFFFSVPEAARFCVENGERIIISPIPDGNREKMLLFLLGTCMGAVLLQRGILPLHGSAVVMDGKAYAFVGESGVGKSTLANAWVAQGYRLLSDDVVAVSFIDGDKPIVAPAYPWQKLWQESLDQLGIRSDRLHPVYERQTKFKVPASTAFQQTSVPLAAIFELVTSSGEGVQIKAVDALAKLRITSQHTYRNQLITAMDLNEWHFLTTTKLCRNLNIYQVARPADGFTVDEMLAQITNVMRKGRALV